ncbi:ACP S-malonyltransferase [Catenulispora subtropica]|uniref:Malonyl CoA-acyl carrier protein transacylase n=2 Tax=Catenulispora subtropica TaxID=450798 RepID=A0ABP5CQZ5_9ACTN
MNDLGILFPGQGTQRPGMGRPWQQTEAWALIGDMSEWTGVDLAWLLLEADAGELRRTDRAQLAVFAAGVLAHAEAGRLGLLSGAVAYAGHSLGEYVALYAAGAIRLKDAAHLVAERGGAMREAAAARPGAMAAVKDAVAQDVEGVLGACRAAGFEVWSANLNAPNQVVVSGTDDGVAAACERVEEDLGARWVRLDVGGAFHSPLMEPAAKRLWSALRHAGFAAEHAPVVANVDARTHVDGADWPRLMEQQLTAPVRWEECVRTLIGKMGCGRFLELGPGRTLGGLAARIDARIPAVSAGTPEALAALVRAEAA